MDFKLSHLKTNYEGFTDLTLISMIHYLISVKDDVNLDKIGKILSKLDPFMISRYNRQKEVLNQDNWIEIHSENDLPKLDCWVVGKFNRQSNKIHEIYFEVNGGYGYNFLMNQCKVFKVIN